MTLQKVIWYLIFVKAVEHLLFIDTLRLVEEETHLIIFKICIAFCAADRN